MSTVAPLLDLPKTALPTDYYDKHKVALHFSRAAQGYSIYDRLQRHCATMLFEQLAPDCQRLVDLGCGPAVNSAKLNEHCQHYLGIDLAEGMLAEAQTRYPKLAFIGGDMEALPLADNSVDCIYGNLVLQWANQPLQVLKECFRCLGDGGSLHLTTVLPGSMEPLNSVLASLDSYPRVNQFHHLAHYQELLASLPWLQIETRTSPLTLEYPSVRAMFAELKGVGANYTPRQQQGLQGKQWLKRVQQLMECYRTAQGTLPMHWQIGVIKARKGVF